MAADRNPVHPVESAGRSAAWGGLATGAATQDPYTAMAVAAALALLAGLGNWGRSNKDKGGIVGFLATVLGSLGA